MKNRYTVYLVVNQQRLGVNQTVSVVNKHGLHVSIFKAYGCVCKINTSLTRSNRSNLLRNRVLENIFGCQPICVYKDKRTSTTTHLRFQSQMITGTCFTINYLKNKGCESIKITSSR